VLCVLLLLLLCRVLCVMRLKRFLLRYYPPGLTLECERADGSVLSKTIDLLHLTPDTDLDECISDIIHSEPFIKEKRRPHIKALLQRTTDSTPARPWEWRMAARAGG